VPLWYSWKENHVAVVQDTLSCGPQSTAAPGTTRCCGVFKIFILSAALVGVGKSYQMTKAVMEAIMCLCLSYPLCSNKKLHEILAKSL